MNSNTPKTILITGATDGIGKLTAKLLADHGHTVLLHGRTPSKLVATAKEIGGNTTQYVADFSRLSDVEQMATTIMEAHDRVDVLINNAGVYKTSHPKTQDGLDTRFVVNTLAPYILTQRLLPIIPKDGRIVNLSSAAQAPVNVRAMAGEVTIDDMAAYAQSKLAITIWSQELATQLKDGPSVVAVNPGSLLASKMVKEGFGVAGKDLKIGADVLCDAALDASFANASGQYFDNDSGRFKPPHVAAQNPAHVREVMAAIQNVIATLSST